ncbi:GNAT family N-acetyltransferase [Nibribacter ruber]|uniref:GNAT family N-acetyltransferase n=1 Tax=Nibribacter ruber TaxID=2698458 RepID=A0A6P1NYW8_9BACT|nr:GNAT family N-acetyltransferase [Nibribacter ruber]QHL87021.1 GNAT family N-acetyltransferase [Nibribacter ruber]
MPLETDFVVETDRLTLSRVTPADAPFILEIVNSPGWLMYIGDRNVHTLEQAHFYMENAYFGKYRLQGFGMYLVRRKEDQAAMGLCGLVQREYLPGPDLGYAFLPGFGGKGYATEAAQGVLTYAREELKIPRLLAMTLPDNHASIRLLEKLGFRFNNTLQDPNTQEDLNLYKKELLS